jgi:glycosyltransferase involved in cell wall biosynthesis
VRIGFIVNDVKGGWSPRDRRLGGTEESVVKWAEELSARGHSVSVYRCRENLTYNTVEYYRDIYQGGNDVVVNVKSSEIAPVEPTLYFTNETDATSLDLSSYDAVAWPSNWAKENITVNNEKVLVIPHGYDDEFIRPGRKVAKQCLYASSPDRGLETLAQIWPAVVEKHPDAQLIVTYGGTIDAPNVSCVGEIEEKEMNDIYRASDIWIHPCSGGELFGITAVKAQAAGCVPVYFPIMALSETVKAGIQCKDARDMYMKLVDILGDKKRKSEIRKELETVELMNWKQSTDILEQALMRLLRSHISDLCLKHGSLEYLQRNSG